MKKTDLEHFKTLFIELRKSHINEGAQQQWGDTKAGDEVDKLLREQNQQLEYKLLGRQSIFIKKIDAALKRIDEGHFGECQDCGADIELKRLNARPTATLCIECKEEQERAEEHVLYEKKSHTLGQTFTDSNVVAFPVKDELPPSSEKVIQFNKSRMNSGVGIQS